MAFSKLFLGVWEMLKIAQSHVTSGYNWIHPAGVESVVENDLEASAASASYGEAVRQLEICAASQVDLEPNSGDRNSVGFEFSPREISFVYNLSLNELLILRSKFCRLIHLPDVARGHSVRNVSILWGSPANVPKMIEVQFLSGQDSGINDLIIFDWWISLIDVLNSLKFSE